MLLYCRLYGLGRSSLHWLSLCDNAAREWHAEIQAQRYEQMKQSTQHARRRR